jgi:hypothetical protein
VWAQRPCSTAARSSAPELPHSSGSSAAGCTAAAKGLQRSTVLEWTSTVDQPHCLQQWHGVCCSACTAVRWHQPGIAKRRRLQYSCNVLQYHRHLLQYGSVTYWTAAALCCRGSAPAAVQQPKNAILLLQLRAQNKQPMPNRTCTSCQPPGLSAHPLQQHCDCLSRHSTSRQFNSCLPATMRHVKQPTYPPLAGRQGVRLRLASRALQEQQPQVL